MADVGGWEIDESLFYSEAPKSPQTEHSTMPLPRPYQVSVTDIYHTIPYRRHMSTSSTTKDCSSPAHYFNTVSSPAVSPGGRKAALHGVNGLKCRHPHSVQFGSVRFSFSSIIILDPDASAAREIYPSQTSTIPYHAIPLLFTCRRSWWFALGFFLLWLGQLADRFAFHTSFTQQAKTHSHMPQAPANRHC